MSSPNGSTSTRAQMQLMAKIRVASSENIKEDGSVPIEISQEQMPRVKPKAKMEKANVPTSDFCPSPKGHLKLFLPYLLPIISAIPSPAAMVVMATTPGKVFLQKVRMKN